MGQWATRQIKGELRDVQLNAQGRPVKLLPWRGPVRLLVAGACRACGEPDPGERCGRCGEGQAAVDKLTDRLAARMGGDLLTAAETAGERGCHVLAVRFATTAWHRGVDTDVAIALRLQELEAAGLGELAAQEAYAWASAPLAPGYAAGIAGELMGRNGQQLQALELVTAAFARSPQDDSLRLDHARLCALNGYALEAGQSVATLCVPGREMADEALVLVLECAKQLMEEDRPEDALTVLDGTAPYGHRSADVCEAIAGAERKRGRLPSARRWLVHTLSLDPQRATAREHLAQLEDKMGIARSTH